MPNIINRKSQTRALFLITLLSIAIPAHTAASPNTIYSASVKGDFERTYKHLYQALENNRLFVVFEPDIGSNLSAFAKRWGDDYNRSKLERIKSMVFCNAWYANQVSNTAINMTALCPQHVTLTHRDGMTSIHFVRPDAVATGSKAESIAAELTELIIKAINEGIQSARKDSSAQ